MIEAIGEPRRLCAPSDKGEVRIPALANVAGETVCLFDVRPAPASGAGRAFTGEVMASDLPNPNYLAYVSVDHPSDPVRFTAEPAISSDACVASDGASITVAYGSVDGPVSYMSSRFAGPRLVPWLAYGADLDSLAHHRLDVLYEETRADALFATSGSTITIDDMAFAPYVVRCGDEAHVRIAHFRRGELVDLSGPITAPHAQIDETSLAYDPAGTVILNARIQGFEGRGAGGRLVAYSSDGLTFTCPDRVEIPDPGSNAKALGHMLIHPHSLTARERGTIVDMRTGRILFDFGPGEFGYSDAIWVPDGTLCVVAERNNELWEWRLAGVPGA